MARKTRNELVALLLVGGSVAVGVGLFSLPGAQAQDRQEVIDAEAAARAARLTDGGVDVLKELRSGCIKARDALVAAEAEHFRSGEPIVAERADKLAKCGAMRAEQERRAADEVAVEAIKRTYWCTHERLGCPPADGGP